MEAGETYKSAGESRDELEIGVQNIVKLVKAVRERQQVLSLGFGGCGERAKTCATYNFRLRSRDLEILPEKLFVVLESGTGSHIDVFGESSAMFKG